MHQTLRLALIGLLIISSFLFIPTQAATPLSCPADRSHLIERFGGRWFLVGANVPWLNGGFGADFATVEEWNQHTYDPNATRIMFRTLRQQGANTVRWWLFADGRGAPEFNTNSGGAVTGLDADFLPALASAIQIAAEEDVYLVFNLWSFDMLMADSTVSGRGEHAGGHRDLIVDPVKRASFINNALLPMLRYSVDSSGYTIGTHPNVLAWDIFNEPEFGINEPPHFTPAHNVTQPVTLTQMQQFIAEISGAIHRNSNQLTTVGSASMKWNSTGALGAVGNFWNDTALTAYDPQGYLDFYQIHYYGWMNGDETYWSYSPLFNDWYEGRFDKPMVIGEVPANASGTNRTPTQLLAELRSNCYAGVWVWPYFNVNDGTGEWSNAASAVQAIANAVPAEVRITANTLSPRVYIPLALR
ncbi:MAG: hypothetical protein C0184_01345 [Chloroflexus aggregans]|uniref:Glycoside hydrolase family 5 domain-containing protein n=1 Tax=Chloroflexus aggregans TaxID=152260 RepID=A0A2J6XEH7_9CHLR|nr:MAG: hypothetical protein C0184_01345 [Chloroflexus aggregans]